MMQSDAPQCCPGPVTSSSSWASCSCSRRRVLVCTLPKTLLLDGQSLLAMATDAVDGAMRVKLFSAVDLDKSTPLQTPRCEWRHAVGHSEIIFYFLFFSVDKTSNCLMNAIQTGSWHHISVHATRRTAECARSWSAGSRSSSRLKQQQAMTAESLQPRPLRLRLPAQPRTIIITS